jgi:dihydroorotate dehydrogenase
VSPNGSATATLARLALPLIARLPPEHAHSLALRGLDALRHSWPSPQVPPSLAVTVFGLRFAHPVGLAAGFDKNADYLDALGALGFSHIEIGTVTPRPQSGNPPPRLRRLRGARALINRMGFNNAGAEHVARRLEQSRYTGIRGVSIGKNADTPLEGAVDDYLACLRGLYAGADYFAINVSSPNTSGLRELQAAEPLARIVTALLDERARLTTRFGKQVPVLVKISPDLEEKDLVALCETVQRSGIDGVIATNTTADLGVAPTDSGIEAGGLSGAPLRPRSLAVLRILRRELAGLPLVGVGGIDDATAAVERLAAGASLVQLYTGFVYRGPSLLNEILDSLAAAPHGR